MSLQEIGTLKCGTGYSINSYAGTFCTDGTYLYYCSSSNYFTPKINLKLYKIRLSDFSLVDTIDFGDIVYMYYGPLMGISTDNSFIIVTYSRNVVPGFAIRKIDLSTFTISASNYFGTSSEKYYVEGAVMGHNSVYFYIACLHLSPNWNGIVKIDTSSFTISGTIQDGKRFYSGRRGENPYIYLAGIHPTADGSVYRLNESSFTIDMSNITVGVYGYDIDIDLSGGYLYYVGQENTTWTNSAISKVRISDLAEIDVLQVSQTYNFGGCDIDGTSLYVAQDNSCRIYKINLNSFTVDEYYTSQYCPSIFFCNCILINGCAYTNFVANKIPPDYSWNDYITKFCSVATPCDNNLSQQPPIGGSCEAVTPPTENYKTLRSSG